MTPLTCDLQPRAILTTANGLSLEETSTDFHSQAKTIFFDAPKGSGPSQPPHQPVSRRSAPRKPQKLGAWIGTWRRRPEDHAVEPYGLLVPGSLVRVKSGLGNPVEMIRG